MEGGRKRERERRGGDRDREKRKQRERLRDKGKEGAGLGSFSWSECKSVKQATSNKLLLTDCGGRSQMKYFCSKSVVMLLVTHMVIVNRPLILLGNVILVL